MNLAPNHRTWRIGPYSLRAVWILGLGRGGGSPFCGSDSITKTQGRSIHGVLHFQRAKHFPLTKGVYISTGYPLDNLCQGNKPEITINKLLTRLLHKLPLANIANHLLPRIPFRELQLIYIKWIQAR